MSKGGNIKHGCYTTQNSILSYFKSPSPSLIKKPVEEILIVAPTPLPTPIPSPALTPTESSTVSINQFKSLFKPQITMDVPTENDKTLICFTDGSCINNGRKYAKAGYAVVWPYHPELDISIKLNDTINTNNRAEYHALIKAFEQAREIDPTYTKTLLVYTDSMLLINTITKWRFLWKKMGWKKADGDIISNKDLVIILDNNLSLRNTQLKHVLAHTGKSNWESIWNDKVDKLAKSYMNN